MDEFKFTVGDVVLAEWEDKLFYAKIQKIDQSKAYCLLIFDDNSLEECPFSKIHSVTETTAEIVCIICKDGNSVRPNEIVLCDKCGIGYHQKCHDPNIPAKAVELDEPWMCTYCVVGAFCPYLENPFETKENKKGHLTRRRLHAIQKDGSLSSGNSTDEDRTPAPQEMSSYYYSSPAQQRDGHRTRGRPSFKHKREERRSRASGRSPGRPVGKDREHQTDEMELNSRKPLAKHEPQQRSHTRYGSPGRNTRHGEDAEGSGGERSRDLNLNSGRKCVDDATTKTVVVAKAHRRDGPREKQRLTQDLARQKRLLSEDIARAQQLQRVQMKNYDGGEQNDSPQSQNEYGQDSRSLSDKEREFTMYEKCYGGSSPDCNDEGNVEESKSPGEAETEIRRSKKAGKTLFERVIPRSCAQQETKNIEFVNDNTLEMCGGNVSESKKSELGRLSPKSNADRSCSDKKDQLDLPIFENVTDDEFAPNDIEEGNYNYAINGVPSLPTLLTNNQDLVTEPDKGNNTNVSPCDKPQNDGKELDHAECECESVNGDEISTERPSVNGLDGESDHSIKKSSITEILEEADIQCEHSNKHAEFDEEVDNIVEEDSNRKCVSPGAEGKNNCASGFIREASEGIEQENYEEKDNEAVLYEQDSDLSNNEGMSDAEEMSDSELVGPAGRSKVRRKKRKKAKSNKTLVKVNSQQRPLRKSKSGRRLGRPPKTNKRLRQMESESEDNAELEFEVDGNGDDNASEEKRDFKSEEVSEHSCLPDKNINEERDNESGESEERVVRKGEELEDGIEVGTTDKDADIEGKNDLSEGEDSHLDSDTEDASQEIFSLTDAERQELEEQGRKEKARKEKRIAARQKRKSEERDREKERSTPPHLVSQHRFMRDLPRHNWLVERLLQQNRIGQEALKAGENDEETVKDGEEGEGSPEMEKEPLPAEGVEENQQAKEDAPGKEVPSGEEESKEAPSSPQRDDFQSELHKSFIRRSFPSKVPRTPPKLKPTSPDHSGGSDKPPPPPLKHKLQPKEMPTLEPLPKLKKIVNENPEKVEEGLPEKPKERHPSPKETEVTKKSQSPIEILDDEEEKKKEFEGGDSNQQDNPVTKTEKSREGSTSPTRKSGFTPPKKGIPFSSPNKVVHSVSPTLPGHGGDMHVSPHHRAAILIPVVPMHDGNGIPLPPSLAPTSPHLNGRSPRTFTPQLITHNSSLSSAGIFGGPIPTSRYTTACMHHMHPGLKPGQCKRDVNCPFHGSSHRGVPPHGLLGMPSHHGPVPPFSQHGPELSSLFSREHRVHRECDKAHCNNPECNLRHEKEPPKLRELERGGGDKMSTPKVVKPIAHVPGMRPPLMLSHLQQMGGQPPHGFDISSLSDEKARRGLEPPSHLSLSKSPDRALRENERRSGQSLTTLSELNRRREQGPLDPSIPGLKRSDFLPPGFSSPPGGHLKPGLLHPKDAAMFSSMPGHPSGASHAEKRDALRSMEEREHLENLLKSGPPRLRPLEEPRELSALRNYSESKREELAIRESLRARENAAYLRHLATKEAGGIPPAKLFDERSKLLSAREVFNQHLSRQSKEQELRLMGSHGNAVIKGMRGIEERTPVKEGERKGGSREEEMSAGRQPATGEGESREREMRDDQAMKELERRRSMELEKEQEKRMNAEREAMRSHVMGRDRAGDPLLRGPEAENHFKAMFRLPRDSPPFMRRGDLFADRLMPTVELLRPEHRLDLRAAAMQDLQRRQEALRVGDPSHRELLGRIASTHKPGGLPERHFSESTTRALSEVRSHSPLTSSRSFPLSLASRQAMDRLAAAAHGKPTPMLKEPDKDIPPHLRAEVERERERERHRLSVEQIEANRRLFQTELKDKINPLALNRDIGAPRDREKEIAALRARERLMFERERMIAIERINEDRKRKREMAEPDIFGPQGRRISPSQFGLPLDRAEYERIKRLKTGVTEPPTSRPHVPGLGGGVPVEAKNKDERALEQRLARPLDLNLAGKPPASMLEREALWIRERERALRAREELSRMKAGIPQPAHGPPGFVSAKDRPDQGPPPRDGSSRGGKTEEEGVNLCSVCKRDASFLCSGCQGAWYCSSECQLSAWSKHSRDCGQSQRQ